MSNKIIAKICFKFWHMDHRMHFWPNNSDLIGYTDMDKPIIKKQKSSKGYYDGT